MKWSMWSIAVGIGVAGSVATARAQVSALPRPVRIGISGGASLPVGNFSNGAKTGFNVSGMVMVKPITMPTAIRLEVQYQRFDEKNGVFNTPGGVVPATGTFSTIGGIVNLMYYLDVQAAVKPYIAGGFGYYHFKVRRSGSGLSGSASENRFGYNLGAGLEFGLGRVSTFLEADWQGILTSLKANNMVPLRFGITL
ncbi:MAG TPA: outer membrane beta-barrel protein [Gemmatimonadaceae bacterium]|nr:outer membrane beta-barrel protein [Gemmatimonadaceae bacterium]